MVDVGGEFIAFTLKVNAAELPVLPAASVCLAVMDLPLPCPTATTLS